MGRKKRKKSTRKGVENYYIFVFLGMIVFFIAIVQYPTVIGLNVNIGMTLTRLFPTLLLSCIGIYMVSNTDRVGRFGGMISLGLGLCLLLDQADTNSLISTPMLSGLNIVQIQIWVMILSIIFGAILYSTKQ